MTWKIVEFQEFFLIVLGSLFGKKMGKFVINFYVNLNNVNRSTVEPLEEQLAT